MGLHKYFIYFMRGQYIHVQHTQLESIRLRHLTIRLNSHGVDPHHRKSMLVKLWILMTIRVDSPDSSRITGNRLALGNNRGCETVVIRVD